MGLKLSKIYKKKVGHQFVWLYCLLFILSPYGVDAANEPETSQVSVTISTPRDFGHVTGDLIEATIDLVGLNVDEIDETSLPKVGPQNRWLDLRHISLEPLSGRFRIHLEYQVFYLPLSVTTLKVPSFSLQRKLTGGGRQNIDVVSWPFTVTPIHGLAVMAEGGMRAMQPDAVPELPSQVFIARSVLVDAVILLLTFSYWGYLNGFISFGTRGQYFREARGQLQHLTKKFPTGGEPLEAAFESVHKAFDQTCGKPLFHAELSAFFEENPAYLPVRSDIESFFRASYGHFFGGGSGEIVTLSEMERLCTACIKAERQRF